MPSDEKRKRCINWRLMPLLGLLIGCTPQSAEPDRVVQYPNSAGDSLPLHLFYPSGEAPDNGWPTVLFFHGGAWQVGNPAQFHPQCYVLSKFGYLCASAAYRVARQHGTTPKEAADDVRASLAYLRGEAKALQVDPTRIVLSGGSAGGHLAALIATGQEDVAPPDQVAALVLFNPMIDLSPGKPDHEYVAEFWEEVSPHHQIKSRLAPTLILMGDQDPEISVEVAEAFCERARGFGGECVLDIAGGQRHGFFNYGISRWQFIRTLYEMREFLAKRGIG